MPHDLTFTASRSKTWIEADELWVRRLADNRTFSVAEKVHLVRMALQQQWICDVVDTAETRTALEALGFTIAGTAEGFLIASGNEAIAEYVMARSNSLGVIEVGILYGYAPAAVVAFADGTTTEANQPWPTTTGQYFLGGRTSEAFGLRERALMDEQWGEIAQRAPAIAALAELAFAESERTRAA